MDVCRFPPGAMIRFRSRTLLLALLSVPALPGVAAVPADAGARPVEIAAGPLDDALKRLALQAHLQLLYEPGLVAGRTGPALRGDFPPRDALRRLLAGSGLRAEPVGDATFVIERVRADPRPPAPAPVAAAPAPAEAAELASVYVTGSHLRRSDADAVGIAPVTVIDRHQIESSGYQTLFELLRFQPGMTGHHPVDVSADGGPGFKQPSAAAATTSLDVLGPRATLFLIDGRRIASYGLVSSDLGGLTDLDGIPLSIVERVEILRGGASAIYGADAMAGVVNIVLKPAGAGAEVSVHAGLSARGDAAQQRLSFNLGRDTARGGGMSIGGELFHRDALQGASRDWRTLDRRRDGLGDGRYAMGYRDAGGALVQPFCAGAAASGAEACRFDPPRQTSLLPATDRAALLWRWRQPFGDGLEWQADARVATLEQRLRSAPFHANITLPPGYPGMPAGADSIDYAFDDVGPIRSRNRTDSHDLAAGLTGLAGDWQWRLRLSSQRNRVTGRVDGLVRESAVLDALAAGSYRFGVGDNPAAVMAAISPRVVSRGTAGLDQWLFDADGPWFALPGGDARLAVGAELQRDGLDNRPDPLMVEHDLALGTQKLPLDAHRLGASAYAELALPWSAHWRGEAALRADHRQGYGGRTSPSLGVTWTPAVALAFRAHWATGYRAPSLFELRRPNVMDGLALIRQSDLTSACRYTVALDGGRYCMVSRGAIENAGLRAETSSSLTLGLVWSPAPAWDIALDRFRIVRRDEIQAVNVAEASHLIPGALVRDAAGRLVGIRDYFDNTGLSDVRGWDADVRYARESGRHGRIVWRLSGTYFRHVLHRAAAGEPLVDEAGRQGVPDHVVLSSLEWTRGRWQTTLGLRRTGPVRVAAAGEACPPANLRAGHCVTPGSTIANLDVAHARPDGWRVSLNIDNLFDRAPVEYDPARGGYDIAHDDPRGRYFGLTIGKTFP